MSKRVCIFPFHERQLTLLKNRDEIINGYSLDCIASLPGYLNGFTEEIEKNGIRIIDLNNESELGSFDVLMVPEFDYGKSTNYINEKIFACETFGKEIIRIPQERFCVGSKIEPVSACVIIVGGIGNHVQINDTTIGLSKAFKKSDVRAEVISSMGGGALFGFNPFPDFMTSNTLCERDKILKFNRFVKELEKATEPDVVIIEIPGTIIPYLWEDKMEDFGMIHWMVSNATPPDCVCINLFAKEYSHQELKVIRDAVYCRCGKEIDCFLMSDFAIDWLAFRKHLEQEPEVLPLSRNITNRYAAELREKKVDIYGIGEIESAFRLIMERLSYSENEYCVL